MATWRLSVDEHGETRLEPLDLLGSPFEGGPWAFEGVGGVVLGDARHVMLMRFEGGARPEFHRAPPSLAILLEGELVLNDSSGGEVVLTPGDAVRVVVDAARVEPATWRSGNRGQGYALLALVQMPAGGRDEER